MQSKEYTYSLYIPLYTDESFETSYDADDSTLRDILESELDETYDEAFDNLDQKISESLDKHLNEILDKFNMNKFEAQLEDTDQVDSSMYYSIWTDVKLSEDQIKDLTDMLKEYLNLDAEGKTDDVEFDGDFIGYEHGWNLPDTGGPPMYSDEKADIYTSVSVIADDIEITYDGEDSVEESYSVKEITTRGAYSGFAGRGITEKLNYTKDKEICSSFPLDEARVDTISDREKGGIITFSEEINAVKFSENKLINWIKQRWETFKNKVTSNKLIDKIGKKHNLQGWTVGKYFSGRYTDSKGNGYGEDSLTLEVIGVTTDTLLSIAEDLCASFRQEAVLVKDYSTGKIMFVYKD